MPRALIPSTALATLLVVAACSSKSLPHAGDAPISSSTPPPLGTGVPDGGALIPCTPDPKNYEIPDNGCDDDGNGTVDDTPTCDGALTGDGTADELARAIGICQTVAKDGYGLVSAVFTQGYGRTDAPHAEQHNVLPKFGDVIRPREGARLGVLSTGYAQEYDGVGQTLFGGRAPTGKDWWTANGSGNGTAPPGFPQPAAGCPIVSDVNDVVDLKLVLKAPPNATGFRFDFDFYSGEWPAYVCSPFNDGFVAYVTASGVANGKGGNISFDKKNNPVSVNNGFFDRCTPGVMTGCAPKSVPGGPSECAAGPTELFGTGFGGTGTWCAPGSSEASTGGGATGWLSSQAPVQPGETFTVELIIWDTGDALLDSSVLLDRFTWMGGQVITATDRPR